MSVNFKKIFNWEIHCVCERVGVYAPVTSDYKKSELIGYNVVVYYKYHEARYHFFGMDDRRCWVMYAGPKEAAQDFYEQMEEKQAKQARKCSYNLYR